MSINSLLRMFLLMGTVMPTFAFQAAPPANRGGQETSKISIKTFDDIEIGMSGDAVTGALVRAGFGVAVHGDARVVSFNGRHTGSFFVDEDGRVKGAQERIYSNTDDNNLAVGLGEALYWLIHDEGVDISAGDQNRRSTLTSAMLSTDDFLSRTPGLSMKRFAIQTKSGNTYIIDLERWPPAPADAQGLHSSSVTIDKVAPFRKKQ